MLLPHQGNCFIYKHKSDITRKIIDQQRELYRIGRVLERVKQEFMF